MRTDRELLIECVNQLKHIDEIYDFEPLATTTSLIREVNQALNIPVVIASACCKNCVHMSKNLKAQFEHEKWHCIETAYYITDPKNHTCEHHSREHLL